MANVGDTLVGRYRLEAPIGAGGFATVFRARDLRLERDVAVKVLSPNHAADAGVLARFDREARSLAAFSHPNVVAIHDVEPAELSVGQETFLVMDLCEGGSLATLIEAAGPGGLAPDVLVPILVDVAVGLDALHAAGMVHRDVKPSNVLLSGGRALIADLGIAAAEPGDMTGSGQAIGTLAYLAPEQLAGSPATPASDVHALGVVAFVGLTGRMPRPAGSIAGLVAASSQDAPLVSSLSADLGTMFDRPVASALAPDPSDRPTVEQLGSRLERGLERWQETAAIRRTRVAGAMTFAAATSIGEAAPTDLAATSADASRERLSEPFADDPTVIAIASPPTKPLPAPVLPPPVNDAPAVDAGSRIGRRGADRQPRIAFGALVLAILLIAALAAVWMLMDPATAGLGGSDASATSEPSLVASEAPSATASLSPSVSPAPTTAAPTPGPYSVALEASQAMHAAIAAARGNAGLNGREAKDLDGPLDRFDRALEKRDGEEARDQADKLADAVRELVENRDIDQEAGARLQAAVADVVAAAEELPD
ncbi:MAG: serine/threonine-protein kinase [Candidatus Limnocylindrales bacterium]